MSQFRAKRLDIAGYINPRIIRDHTKRQVFKQFEPERQVLRYLIRNTALPMRVRAQAQLKLSQMHCYTNPTQIKNRCTAGGIARGVFRDFRMARVSLLHSHFANVYILALKIVLDKSFLLTAYLSPQQFQFRMHALAGDLPGVKKASW
ncbi:hypothetical protein FQN50_004253 [Emmonsiellopsis sp. PD_5]|nr:hypothetical protein FQN50_004253 [Emmonsiellopsis sp. PD_5]